MPAGAGEQRRLRGLALLAGPLAERLARPDLEPVAETDQRHPVGEPEHLAEALWDGDAAGGVERQLRHAAHDRGFQRRTVGIAKRKLVDQLRIGIEERLAAALDAVGL